MRDLISVLLILISLIKPSFGQQWETVVSGTDKKLNDVQFPTDNTGYIVGHYGTILKSTDGGLSWSALSSGVDKELNSVYFINDLIGFAVGYHSKILKTIDGGVSWTEIMSGTAYRFFDVIFLNENIGFTVGGSNPTIFKTVDGGDNWTKSEINTEKEYYIYSIDFINTTEGYAVGSEYVNSENRGVILKTEDAGDTWEVQDFGSIIADFRSVYFLNSRIGFITGGLHKIENRTVGVLFKTTDGGISWNKNEIDTEERIHDIFFIDGETGYLAGPYGTLLKTDDGGISWSKQEILPFLSASWLHSLWFTDAEHGIAVGYNGVIALGSPLPSFSVSFTVKEGSNYLEDASIQLEGYGTQITNSNGVATFSNVQSGNNISYTISKDGYDVYSGNIDVLDQEISISISLIRSSYYVEFIVDDGTDYIENASVDLDGFGKQLTNSYGKTTFDNVNPAENIGYNVSIDGYIENSGNVTVSDQDVTLNVTLNRLSYTITFTITDGINPLNNVSVTLDNYGSKVTNNNGLVIFNNIIQTNNIAFSITKEGYSSVTGTTDIIDKDVIIDIVLNENAVWISNDRKIPILIYPNPSNGTIYIRNLTWPASLEILCLDGTCIFRNEYYSAGTIEVNNLNPGIYIIRLQSIQGLSTNKFIVN